MVGSDKLRAHLDRIRIQHAREMRLKQRSTGKETCQCGGPHSIARPDGGFWSIRYLAIPGRIVSSQTRQDAIRGKFAPRSGFLA